MQRCIFQHCKVLFTHDLQNPHAAVMLRLDLVTLRSLGLVFSIICHLPYIYHCRLCFKMLNELLVKFVQWLMKYMNKNNLIMDFISANWSDGC